MRKAWIGAVLALTVTVAGCTGGGDDGKAAPTAAPTSVDVAAAVTSSTSGATLAAPLPVLASVDTTVQSKPVRIDLNEVRVIGQVMTVSWSVTDTREDTGETNTGWSLGYAFAQGGVLGDHHWSVNGVYVIDPKNAKRYLSATSADDTCACSNGLATQIGPGQSVVLTNTFKAPPEDVTDVVVMIPFAKAMPAKVAR